jgi:hypothetical protein
VIEPHRLFSRTDVTRPPPPNNRRRSAHPHTRLDPIPHRIKSNLSIPTSFLAIVYALVVVGHGGAGRVRRHLEGNTDAFPVCQILEKSLLSLGRYRVSPPPLGPIPRRCSKSPHPTKKGKIRSYLSTPSPSMVIVYALVAMGHGGAGQVCRRLGGNTDAVACQVLENPHLLGDPNGDGRRPWW